VTKLEILLARGYFPKELPPAFYTSRFAKYATSKAGKSLIEQYKATDNFTECVKYLLALPGGHRRELRIPHPAAYANLSILVTKNLARLLKIANKSKFAASKPDFTSHGLRAFVSEVSPSYLATERAARRGGASFLVKGDVSQFYPSLYTHAVGWAIDPKLRLKKYWQDKSLLGKKLDQQLMDLDGKMSQGIPIGGDVFYLLAECVLSQVDAAFKPAQERAYRWFDDYEIAVRTRDEAESYMRRLSKELSRFRLRLNPTKTRIADLPFAADEEWQQLLVQTGGRSRMDSRDMVKHFDTAFNLREKFPDSPVLLYALGVLFGIPRPNANAGRIAQSCLSQAMLAEPGAAQKGFALLSYWRTNGFALDASLITRTINHLIARHEAAGVSSDVAWALSFCIEQKIALDANSGKILSSVEDDCIALQALHMGAISLLPKGFAISQISKLIKQSDLDREHWLLCYESLRQGFLNDAKTMVASNSLFNDFLQKKVSFYRTTLPSYAGVIHPGGAPNWLLRLWIEKLQIDLGLAQPGTGRDTSKSAVIPSAIENDIRRLGTAARSDDDPLVAFLSLLDAQPLAATDITYPV